MNRVRPLGTTAGDGLLGVRPTDSGIGRLTTPRETIHEPTTEDFAGDRRTIGEHSTDWPTTGENSTDRRTTDDFASERPTRNIRQ